MKVSDPVVIGLVGVLAAELVNGITIKRGDPSDACCGGEYADVNAFALVDCSFRPGATPTGRRTILRGWVSH